MELFIIFVGVLVLIIFSHWWRGKRNDHHHQFCEIRSQLDTILSTIVTQGARLMAANEQVIEFLVELNAYTNEIAEAEEEQAAAISEIAEDIDRLVAAGESELSPETVTALRAHADSLKTVSEQTAARVQTLTNIAAKSDNPLPPPVTP